MAYSLKTLVKRNDLITRLKEITRELEAKFKENAKQYPASLKNTRYNKLHEDFRKITGANTKRKRFSFKRNVGTSRLEEALMFAEHVRGTIYFKEGYGAFREKVKQGHWLSGVTFTDAQFDAFVNMMNDADFMYMIQSKHFSSSDVRDVVLYQARNAASDIVNAFKIVWETFDDVGGDNETLAHRHADMQLVIGLSKMLSQYGYNDVKYRLQEALDFEFDFDETIRGFRFQGKGKILRKRISGNILPDLFRGIDLLKAHGSLSHLSDKERGYYYNIFQQFLI